MSVIAPFVVLGLFLGILLVLWARPRPEPFGLEKRGVSDPESALDLLRFELLPVATVDILFSRADWDFVRRTASRQVEHMFLRERTALALLWLEETRKQMGGLMKMHRHAARSLKDVRPEIETALALRYFVFLMNHELLRWAVLLCGPFRVRSVVVHSASSARGLCSAFEKLFAAQQHAPARLQVPSQFGF
jgi:hypothetical protein